LYSSGSLTGSPDVSAYRFLKYIFSSFASVFMPPSTQQTGRRHYVFGLSVRLRECTCILRPACCRFLVSCGGCSRLIFSTLFAKGDKNDVAPRCCYWTKREFYYETRAISPLQRRRWIKSHLMRARSDAVRVEMMRSWRCRRRRCCCCCIQCHSNAESSSHVRASSRHMCTSSRWASNEHHVSQHYRGQFH